MLRNRIELLERVLKNNGIDVETSVAQLMTEDLAKLSNQAKNGDPSTVEDDLCVTFEGALTLDESLNFDQDGEVRYFGPTSGRLLFRSSGNSAYEISLTRQTFFFISASSDRTKIRLGMTPIRRHTLLAVAVQEEPLV